MPMLVINTFGNGQIEAHQLLDLSLTTIGNLGDRHNVTCMALRIGWAFTRDSCNELLL
jgi:hypothetical protein